MFGEKSECGNSHTIGVILVIALTLIIALLVLLLIHIPTLEWNSGPDALFLIVSISHSDRPPGFPENFDSRITLMNSGQEPYPNDDLAVKIYRNGNLIECSITTLNGHNFISTRHYGVQTISGSGCQGDQWQPGEKIALDLSDSTIIPGDRIRVDVLLNVNDRVISRDEALA